MASDTPPFTKPPSTSTMLQLPAPGWHSSPVSPTTPSVDVQICINDVTVVDDVSMTSDTDSCLGTETVARRQRRRLSWCPEHSDDAEKQRLLSITGRRCHVLLSDSQFAGRLCLCTASVMFTVSQKNAPNLEICGFDKHGLIWVNFYPRDVYVSAVLATATWLAGWVSVCHTPVLYQNG